MGEHLSKGRKRRRKIRQERTAEFRRVLSGEVVEKGGQRRTEVVLLM
jgi:hypothetical protein